MTKEDFEDAKLLWKMFYALDCFRRCGAAAKHISDHKLDEGDALYYPLLTAVYVLYAKPFKKAYGGVGQLDDAMIPRKYKALHEQLISHRDQVYAHKDAAPSDVPPEIGKPTVFFRVTPPMICMVGTDFLTRHPYMTQVINLCQMLEEKAGYYVGKLEKKHHKDVPDEEGDYRVNIYDQNGSFVERATQKLH